MPWVLWCCLLPDGIDNIVDSGGIGPLSEGKSFAVSNSFVCHCVPSTESGPSLHRTARR